MWLLCIGLFTILDPTEVPISMCVWVWVRRYCRAVSIRKWILRLHSLLMMITSVATCRREGRFVYVEEPHQDEAASEHVPRTLASYLICRRTSTPMMLMLMKNWRRNKKEMYISYINSEIWADIVRWPRLLRSLYAQPFSFACGFMTTTCSHVLMFQFLFVVFFPFSR